MEKLRYLILRGGSRLPLMSTLTNATNATGRNFVFSKGYTIQGVPKNALSELPFVKPGLRVNGLPLPVGCFPGSARPCTLKPSFEKRQFRKCFSLGHPVERRYLQYFRDMVKYLVDFKYFFLAIFLSFFGKKDNNPNKRKMANFEDSGGKERLPSIERPQIAASAPVPPIWRAQSLEPPSHSEASLPSRSEWRTTQHPQSCPHFT